jgi:hypothetical protein
MRSLSQEARRCGLEREKNIQMLDEENTKEVHQQRAQANAQETQQGDRMGAETPVQVSLPRLEGFLFHDARTES